MTEKYTNIKVNKKENSQVEITGEIPVAVIADYRKNALKDINNRADIAGFRKGHIPEKMILDRFGEMLVLEEAAELALKDIVPDIVTQEVPNYIGRPNISITKIAPENPLEFKIEIAVAPEVTLPDYKKIAQSVLGEKEERIEVTEKEIDMVIEEIRKQHAHQEFHKQNKDTKDHNHDDAEIEKFKPEFTDEFVKKVGSFTDVADFRTKAKENMTKEKEHRALEKRRITLLEKIVEKTEVSLPKILIDSELSRMLAQFEGDISNMGLKVEDYLKHLKKTPEDLRKEWLPDAEKRAKLTVTLGEIAKKENIIPEPKVIEDEVAYLLKQYKDADPVRTRAYVEHNLTIEKAIQFLESQKS